MQIQVGDPVDVEGFAAHDFTDYGKTLWYGFVPRPTPPGTDNGLTLIVAEYHEEALTYLVACVIGDVWPKGDSQNLTPERYAETKRDDINAFQAEYFGGMPGDPTLPDDFEIWASQVIPVIQGWTVDGARLASE